MTATYWVVVLIRVALGAVVIGFGAFMTDLAWQVAFDTDLDGGLAFMAGLITAFVAMSAPYTRYKPHETTDRHDGMMIAGAVQSPTTRKGQGQ